MSPSRFETIAGLGFEQVIRNAPVAIAVVDASGRVIDTNERARDLTVRQLGAEMPEDLDLAIDIFHPDGRRYERDEWPAVRSIRSGEEVVEEEFFYALPDGRRLFMRCSSSPVRDKDGEVVAAVVVMADVTERKREEERLAYLAGLLDNTEDAIVALDAEWFVTAWNKGAEAMYGWTADEVVGRHTLEVAKLDMSSEARTEVRIAVAERGRWRGEVVAYRKDGAAVPVELITVALRGEGDRITGYLEIHRDIGERRRAEEAAQRREETILESITDAFVAVDRGWRYTYVNDRALRRLEAWRGKALSREEILGKGMWELFPEAAGTEVERRLRDAMDAKEAVEFELYFAPTDEWVEAHAYPSPSGLSVYYRNISARRRAEEAAREADQQRAEADRRLDLVLEAERSRIARDLHDEALQGLAHALVITGSREAGRDGEVAGILQQVERQLRAAIYDLRLEPDGERPFSAALRELVEVAREMRPGCDVTLETGDDLPGAALERRGTEVLRIVREAVNNACRHATAERIVVRAMGSGTRLVVEVTDDGRGFYPARQTPALQGQGLRGMRERAELLEADLDVRSDRTGTTVRLQLDLGSA